MKEVDLAQQYLQYKGLTLDRVATKINALELYLREEREKIVDTAIEKARNKAEEYDIVVERRVR